MKFGPIAQFVAIGVMIGVYYLSGMDARMDEIAEFTELQLILAHKGFVWFDVETTGRAAHGSRPDLGVDAIAHMGRVLVELEKLNESLLSGPAKAGPFFMKRRRGRQAPFLRGGSCRHPLDPRRWTTRSCMVYFEWCLFRYPFITTHKRILTRSRP